MRVSFKGNLESNIPIELFDIANNFVGTITSLVETDQQNQYNCLGYIEKAYFENSNTIQVRADDNKEILELTIIQ